MRPHWMSYSMWEALKYVAEPSLSIILRYPYARTWRALIRRGLLKEDRSEENALPYVLTDAGKAIYDQAKGPT